MLRTHRARKGPGDCGGWGLGSRSRRGPGVAPTPGLRGRGTSPGSPAGFMGSSGRGKCPPLLSCSSGPEGPSRLPLLTSPASLLCPQGPTQPGGGFGGQGIGLGAQQAPVPKWEIALRSSPTPPRGSLPPASLISLVSGAPILSGLHFSYPSVPPRPTSSPGGSSHLLGVRLPHQRPAGALVVGKR